jgi:hypothetical protein
MKCPPRKQGSMSDEKTGDRYNSVVDDEETPSIFVVFKDYQAYPTYLIEFETVCDTQFD